MVFMRRAVAMLVVLTLTVSVGVTATMCAGWESTASARMDCCAAMGHEAHDQAEADSCCERAERAQQEFEPDALPPAAVRWTPEHADAPDLQPASRRHPHRSPPLFLSAVLRI
jgi:hypothetical protein